MMKRSIILLAGIMFSANVWAAPVTANQADAIAQSVQAQSLKQGDLESLKKAEEEYTPEGLTVFTKTLNGFLDDKGAPTFTQTVTPGDPTVFTVADGVVTLAYAAVMKQTSGSSTTTYHGTVETELKGSPLKISHLKFKITPKGN